MFAQQNNANKQETAAQGTPIDKLVRFHVEIDYYTYSNYYYGNVSVTNGATLTPTETGGDINVENVKVQNNAKLILDAAKEVNFDDDFEIELGSKLEIK